MAWRDPWDTVDRANALRAQTDAQTVGMLGSLQGMQMNALQRQNLERQMADERAVREAYTQGAGDPTRTRDLLTRGGFYRQVQDMDKAALDKRKTEASIGKDEADAAVKRAQMERDAIAGINDQAGWDAFRQSIGDRAGRLPAQFSPEVKLSLVTRADDYVKRMTPDFKEMDLGGKRVTVDMNPYTNPAIRGAEFGKTATIGEQETARHNQVQEGISRGNLGVAQANLGLSRQRLEQDRQNAASGRVPQGYRMKPDGSLEAIPGGPADIGKALPSPAVKDLSAAGASVEDTRRLTESFKDAYGGKTLLGGMSNTIGRIVGDPSGQAQWWQDMDALQNQTRHALFGSALTKTELDAWEKTSINPRMNSEEIKANLSRRQQIEERAASKLARSYEAAGYNKNQIKELLGVAADYINKPAPPASPAGNRKALTPDEQRELQELRQRLGKKG